MRQRDRDLETATERQRHKDRVKQFCDSETMVGKPRTDSKSETELQRYRKDRYRYNSIYVEWYYHLIVCIIWYQIKSLEHVVRVIIKQEIIFYARQPKNFYLI